MPYNTSKISPASYMVNNGSCFINVSCFINGILEPNYSKKEDNTTVFRKIYNYGVNKFPTCIFNINKENFYKEANEGVDYNKRKEEQESQKTKDKFFKKIPKKISYCNYKVITDSATSTDIRKDDRISLAVATNEDLNIQGKQIKGVKLFGRVSLYGDEEEYNLISCPDYIQLINNSSKKTVSISLDDLLKDKNFLIKLKIEGICFDLTAENNSFIFTDTTINQNKNGKNQMSISYYNYGDKAITASTTHTEEENYYLQLNNNNLNSTNERINIRLKAKKDDGINLAVATNEDLNIQGKQTKGVKLFGRVSFNNNLNSTNERINIRLKAIKNDGINLAVAAKKDLNRDINLKDSKNKICPLLTLCEGVNYKIPVFKIPVFCNNESAAEKEKQNAKVEKQRIEKQRIEKEEFEKEQERYQKAQEDWLDKNRQLSEFHKKRKEELDKRLAKKKELVANKENNNQQDNEDQKEQIDLNINLNQDQNKNPNQLQNNNNQQYQHSGLSKQLSEKIKKEMENRRRIEAKKREIEEARNKQNENKELIKAENAKKILDKANKYDFWTSISRCMWGIIKFIKKILL